METENPNITVVHKGFFYFIFYLISLPFRGIFIVIKFIWKYISIYLGWVKESHEYNKKQKDLNNMLSVNKLQEEIL